MDTPHSLISFLMGSTIPMGNLPQAHNLIVDELNRLSAVQILFIISLIISFIKYCKGV